VVSDKGSSGKRDLECHGVIRGLLLGQLDPKIARVLSPLEFSLVAQQLDITNPRHAVLTTNCQSGDLHLFARPAHNESIQCVALRGEAHIVGSQIFAFVLVEPLAQSGCRLRTWAVAGDLPRTGAVNAFAVYGHPPGYLIQDLEFSGIQFTAVG
jgi:hypothetical protein